MSLARPIPEPSPANEFLSEHIELLRSSLRRLTGRDLVDGQPDPVAAAREVLEAPFVVLSHDAGTDPVFTYANRTALELFEMSFAEITQLPSRRSAEPLARAERERLLQQVSERGFIDSYRGVRIAKSGRRFMIEEATVWNLVDDAGIYQGQAATFAHWRFLD